MKLLRVHLLALGFFLGSWIPAHAVEPPVSGQATADSTTSNIFLLQVTFRRLDSILTGTLCSLTSPVQKFCFRVFPTKLVNLDNQEDLLCCSTAFFAISDSAFQSEGTAQPLKYCLEILREMAINTDSGAELSMFLRVREVGRALYVVRAADGCRLFPVGSASNP
jgi:hypothetical protein